MLETAELTPLIGSEVRIDGDLLLSGEHAAELRELLVRRGVVAIRGLDFDDSQLAAFTATIGKVRMGAISEDEAGMLKVVHIAGAYFWHVDGTYTTMPPFATVLSPRVVAPEGGDTEFCNTYAAFEDLPAEEQKYLSTLEVVHTVKAAYNHAVPEPTLEQFQQWQGRAVRPLVWRHRSGRRSLVVGATASHVVGMHVAESHELLERLTAHMTQDRYVYRHKWRMGDVVVWDNTGTMHRVRPFDLSSGRLMHRFAVEGVEPLAAEPRLAAAVGA